jgi:hypothetical protein
VFDIALGDYFAPLQNLANYVSELPTSIQLRESQYVMPWVFVLHVVSMMMFAGTILMMDLRLLGVGYMQTPFSQVQRRLFPWQMAAMLFSAITGLALVWGNPLNYVTNIIFWVKMLAMVLAGINALAFHFITEYTLIDWDAGQTPPSGAKLAGALSIVLWANVIVAGRLIPYALTWFRS